MGRRSLRHGIDDREGVEDVDDVQNRTYGKRRPDHRQRDMAQLVPEARPVHGGRLIERSVDGLQAGEHTEGDKRNRDENADPAFPDKFDLITGAPVDGLTDNAQVQQDVVQVAVFGLDDVVPYRSLNDERSCPGEDHNGAGDLLAVELLVQNHGNDEAEQCGQDDHREHPPEGVQHDGFERGQMHRLDIVVKANEAADHAGF